MVPRVLIHAILEQHILSPWGVHGVDHWGRVLENGLRLAESTGADTEVVTYFAVFHDACRECDGHDPEHGRRGAALAGELWGSLFQLDDQQFAQLEYACTHHTSGDPDTVADIPTVATCWDADRLDLGRVGIYPDSSRLCTEIGRRHGTIRWAVERSGREHVPDFVEKEWLEGTVWERGRR